MKKKLPLTSNENIQRYGYIVFNMCNVNELILLPMSFLYGNQ
jgi:hypothetical protein